MHQSVPGSPYSENYQQTLGPYGRGYGAPTPYQPAPQAPAYPSASQPGMFIPSQAPQVPQVFCFIMFILMQNS